MLRRKETSLLGAQPYQFLSWPSVEPYDRRTMLPRRPEAMDDERRDLEAPYE